MEFKARLAQPGAKLWGPIRPLKLGDKISATPQIWRCIFPQNTKIFNVPEHSISVVSCVYMLYERRRQQPRNRVLNVSFEKGSHRATRFSLVPRVAVMAEFVEPANAHWSPPPMTVWTSISCSAEYIFPLIWSVWNWIIAATSRAHVATLCARSMVISRLRNVTVIWQGITAPLMEGVVGRFPYPSLCGNFNVAEFFAQHISAMLSMPVSFSCGLNTAAADVQNICYLDRPNTGHQPNCSGTWNRECEKKHCKQGQRRWDAGITLWVNSIFITHLQNILIALWLEISVGEAISWPYSLLCLLLICHIRLWNACIRNHGG